LILPPPYSTSIFPDDNIPEKEKLDPKFGRAVARALYSKFYNNLSFIGYGNWGAMQEIRAYGAGLQSSQKYKNYITNGSPIGNSSLRQNSRKNNTGSGADNLNTFGNQFGQNRKAFTNISYDIFSPMAKLSNVLLSIMSDNDYKLDCVSLDKNTVTVKKRNKAETYVKSKLINPLAEQLGLPKMYVPFTVNDKNEIETADKLGFFKTRQEVALEKLAELGFRASRWKDKRPKINRDAIDFGFRIAKLYHDRITGQVKFKYVDPCTTVMLWNEDEDSQPPAIGHVERVKIQDIFNDLLAAGLDEKQIQAMAKDQQVFQGSGANITPWMWERKDPTTNQWLWMDFYVYVLHFEYLSTDYKSYSEQKIKDKVYYNRIKNKEKFTKANPKAEVDEYHVNYWYEGSYVISGSGQDVIYGWRKKPNQMQKGLTPVSSYVFDRILGEAPTSRVIGLLDDLMFAVLKLRVAVAAAAPKGYAIDVSAAANIKIGGKEYDMFDLIHIHKQNGIRVLSTKFNAATGKFQADVLRPEDNGIGPQAVEWMNQIANTLNMIKDTLGIPDIMAASPNQSGERAVAVMENDIDSGNNANWILKESERRFKEKLGEAIIRQSRIDMEYDKEVREFYASVIGEDMCKALDEMEGLNLDQLGISTKILPTEKEKDLIMQRAVEMSKIATRDGSVLLRPSSVERVGQLLKNDDIDEALWFMQAEENASRKREQEWAAQMQQQTIQGQQQSALVTEEAKRQTALQLAQIEIMKNREVMNMEIQKEKELKMLEKDADYKIQLLKGQQALDEINLEATLENMYGNEITGRV